MSILQDREVPNIEHLLDRYPRKGEQVRVVLPGKHGERVIIGTHTGKVARMRGGAVLGVITPADGTKEKLVPWTLDRAVVRFYGSVP